MGKFNFNEEDFEKIKNEAEELYKTIGEIYCPYFQTNISFNAKGLRHLKFKSDEQARPTKDQYPRLKLIKFTPTIIEKSNTLQGIKKERRFEEQKTNNRREYTMKDVIYYEFIAVLENIRFKVIIKEVVGGGKYFWSVIPYWGINKEQSKRVLYSGDPEID